MSEKDWFQKDFNNKVLALSRSTDRSTVSRAALLCRSTEQSTDMHQSALCALRSTERSNDCKSFAFGWVQSTAPVDRQRALISGWDKQSTAIPNGRKSDRWRLTGRSTDRRISFWFFPIDYIFVCLFLNLFPIALLGFLLMFSSLINSETVEKPINKLTTSFNHQNQVLAFSLKYFLLSQNFIFLIFSLSLSSTSLKAISTT